jgi:hypothetical protein
MAILIVFDKPSPMRTYILLFLVAVVLMAGCIGVPNITINSSYNSSLTSGNGTKLATGDCGTMGCFINNSKTCTPSKFNYSISINFFGANSTTVDFLQINGTENGKCIFYIKTLNSTVKYSDALRKQLIQGGETDAQVTEQETEANDAQKTMVGRDGTCKFDNADLTAMLTNWNDGKFSSSDYSKADCTGPMFAGYSSGSNTTTVNGTSISYNYTVSYNYTGGNSTQLPFGGSTRTVSYTVSEGSTASVTCEKGYVISNYTSIYGTNCPSSGGIKCGQCPVGSSGCTVTFSNTDCGGDPCYGTVKKGKLSIVCTAADK